MKAEAFVIFLDIDGAICTTLSTRPTQLLSPG